jgi:Rrf2 family protein
MIKLSKKWYYSLKAILYLAEKKWILIKISEISKDLDISETFLRRIINNLEKSFLVKTVKWRNWWVILYKNLKTISLYDIFLSIGEDLSIKDCTSWIVCKNKDTCSTIEMLNALQKWFNSLLKVYTLDKITKNPN